MNAISTANYMIPVKELITFHLLTLVARFILGALPLPAVHAADYFSRATGSDLHTGTVGEPFATIQKGIDQLQAGDTLHLREGSYHEQFRIVSLHGRKGKPITVKAYEGERVTLDGSVPIRSKWVPYQGRIFMTKLEQPVWQLFVGKKSMSIPLAQRQLDRRIAVGYGPQYGLARKRPQQLRPSLQRGSEAVRFQFGRGHHRCRFGFLQNLPIPGD